MKNTFTQVETHKEARFLNQKGDIEVVQPIATLSSIHGDVFHIIEQNYEYALLCSTPNRCYKEGETNLTPYWFPEAIDVLKTLPTPERPKYDPAPSERVVGADSVYMTAAEAINISTQNTSTHILNMVKVEALKGNRNFEFKMSKQEIEFLQSLGYKVQYMAAIGCQRISW